VGAVQAGIALYASQQLSAGNNATYPATLDSATNAVASRTNTMFSTVIQGGVARGWTRVSGVCYQWTEGGASDNYKYDSTAGTFLFVATCP